MKVLCIIMIDLHRHVYKHCNKFITVKYVLHSAVNSKHDEANIVLCWWWCWSCCFYVVDSVQLSLVCGSLATWNLASHFHNIVYINTWKCVENVSKCVTRCVPKCANMWKCVPQVRPTYKCVAATHEADVLHAFCLLFNMYTIKNRIKLIHNLFYVCQL